MHLISFGEWNKFEYRLEIGWIVAMQQEYNPCDLNWAGRGNQSRSILMLCSIPLAVSWLYLNRGNAIELFQISLSFSSIVNQFSLIFNDSIDWYQKWTILTTLTRSWIINTQSKNALHSHSNALTTDMIVHDTIIFQQKYSHKSEVLIMIGKETLFACTSILSFIFLFLSFLNTHFYANIPCHQHSYICKLPNIQHEHFCARKQLHTRIMTNKLER